MTFTWRRLYIPRVVWGVLSTTQRVLVISNSSALQRLLGRAICLPYQRPVWSVSHCCPIKLFSEFVLAFFPGRKEGSRSRWAALFPGWCL